MGQPVEGFGEVRTRREPLELLRVGALDPVEYPRERIDVKLSCGLPRVVAPLVADHPRLRAAVPARGRRGSQVGGKGNPQGAPLGGVGPSPVIGEQVVPDEGPACPVQPVDARGVLVLVARQFGEVVQEAGNVRAPCWGEADIDEHESPAVFAASPATPSRAASALIVDISIPRSFLAKEAVSAFPSRGGRARGRVRGSSAAVGQDGEGVEAVATVSITATRKLEPAPE